MSNFKVSCLVDRLNDGLVNFKVKAKAIISHITVKRHFGNLRANVDIF